MSCTVEGCLNPSIARGWCSMHYGRVRRGGELGDAQSTRQRQGGACETADCDRVSTKRGLCDRCYLRKMRATYPGRQRDLRDRREYQFQRKLASHGLTQADYDSMLAAQGERCAICRKGDPGGKGRWHVDHCHRTNVVRGLLCHNCNVGLGNFKDDPAALLAAIAYLEPVAVHV